VFRPVSPDPKAVLRTTNAFCVFTDEGRAKEYAKLFGEECSEALPEFVGEGFEALALPVDDVYGLRAGVQMAWRYGEQFGTHVLLDPTHADASYDHARRHYGGTLYEMEEFERNCLGVPPTREGAAARPGSPPPQGPQAKPTPQGQPSFMDLVAGVVERATKALAAFLATPKSRGAERGQSAGQRAGSRRAYVTKDRRDYTLADELQWFWDNLLATCGVLLGATGVLFCVLALMACSLARETLDVDASVFSFLAWALLISLAVGGVSAIFVDWKNRPRSTWER
jgi:hypothetical protein